MNAIEQTEHLNAIADRLSRAGRGIRAAIETADAADIFTQVFRDIDKHLWFVESHLAV